jgi:hypothetical protein
LRHGSTTSMGCVAVSMAPTLAAAASFGLETGLTDL